MKKAIYFTYLYHAVCFISMIFGQLTKNETMIKVSFFGDIAGAFALPLLIAAVAMALSVRDQKRVILQYPQAAAAIGVIGLARGIIFFFVSAKNGFMGAMMYLVISFLFLTMWFAIFEISSRFMNSGTKFTKKKRK